MMALWEVKKAAAEVGLELVEIWIESPNEYETAFVVMRGSVGVKTSQRATRASP
jgi:ABC-type uncharacterized transport system substrate-binding protein